jgi:hypothetical protein
MGNEMRRRRRRRRRRRSKRQVHIQVNKLES